VLSPQDGLWLNLLAMDEPGSEEPHHGLEVWSDNPAAALPLPCSGVTVKGSIVDFRVLEDETVCIVIDARDGCAALSCRNLSTANLGSIIAMLSLASPPSVWRGRA
jgi:hypothetical protein